uniref:Putative secreted protein n=1 Tax=Ixodes ricinus TaxID=34613 RepID=A0A6B0UF59_IXORI
MNWVLSMRRIEAGLICCLVISRRQATPGSNVGKTMDPYRWTSGSGRTLIVTCVTTPSVPSEPSTKWWTSGPPDRRGTWQLRSSTPLGVTRRTCTTRSSMLP